MKLTLEVATGVLMGGLALDGVHYLQHAIKNTTAVTDERPALTRATEQNSTRTAAHTVQEYLTDPDNRPASPELIDQVNADTEAAIVRGRLDAPHR